MKLSNAQLNTRNAFLISAHIASYTQLDFPDMTFILDDHNPHCYTLIVEMDLPDGGWYVNQHTFNELSELPKIITDSFIVYDQNVELWISKWHERNDK